MTDTRELATTLKMLAALPTSHRNNDEIDESMTKAADTITALSERVKVLEGELLWRKTTEGLPKKPGKRDYEQVECLIMMPGGEIEISMWNCEHEVWDDADGDDYRHDPCKPTHWLHLGPIRAALAGGRG